MASTAAQRSITSHPAFRWMVALWFAALVGFGLFVMPAQTHEFILARTGLVLPRELPPRLAVSLAGGLLGFLLGLLIAGRSRRSQDDLADEWAEEHPEDDEYDPAPAPVAERDWDEPTAKEGRRRLFNPREDLGEDGIAAPALPVEEPQYEDAEYEDADFEEVIDEDGEWSVLGGDQGIPPDPFTSTQDAPPPVQPRTIEPDAIADLSLTELTARLGRALAAASGQAPAADQLSGSAPDDTAAPVAGHSEEALRSALERLSRVRRGD